MSWSNGNDRNVFLKLESKLGLCYVVLTTPKTSHEKLTQAVVEMQQLLDFEKTDSKITSCLKWTKSRGKRKICLNYKTYTNELKIFV